MGHAPANLAPAKGRTGIHQRRSLQCSIGMESGTLPLTSPSQRILSEKLRYPCFSQVPAGSDCPLSCLYCISRYNSLIVTVLLFTGFRKYRAQIAPLPDLLYISRFILLVSTVLRFASLQVSGSGCPLSKAYRVNIAPYYLFTLKNTFHYRKLYDIRVFV